MAMQDALISPITKPTKKPPPPSTAKPPQRIKAKKLSRKKRLQNLERQVYDLEGVLTRAQRSRTTLLPWEEIALAFKEDTLNQVRDHRSLKRQLQRQEHVNLVLQTWVTAMLLPPQRTLNPHAATWRHSHLIQGDDDIRRTAQLWIMQHSYHSTDRAMSRHSFPDSMESLVEVNVAVDDDGGGGLFRVDCMVQYTVDLPLQEASDVYWLAENSFTSYRQDAPTFFEDHHAVQHAALRYDRQVMSVHMAKQNIRSHSLHGQFRTPSRTTVVCRTILHDEAFPEEDAAAWVLDAHLWTVAEPVGPYRTRLRTVYSLDHPRTAAGRVVSADEMATEFHLHQSGHVRAFLNRAHVRQRQLFFDHLTNLIRCTTTAGLEK